MCTVDSFVRSDSTGRCFTLLIRSQHGEGVRGSMCLCMYCMCVGKLGVRDSESGKKRNSTVILSDSIVFRERRVLKDADASANSNRNTTPGPSDVLPLHKHTPLITVSDELGAEFCSMEHCPIIIHFFTVTTLIFFFIPVTVCKVCFSLFLEPKIYHPITHPDS